MALPQKHACCYTLAMHIVLAHEPAHDHDHVSASTSRKSSWTGIIKVIIEMIRITYWSLDKGCASTVKSVSRDTVMCMERPYTDVQF